MAASAFSATNYTSEEFVESCGAVLFDFASDPVKVCLIHYIKHDEWLLPKGRRNCHESRKQAALREVQEETGYACSLHPVTMPTRAPPAEEVSDVPDKPRTCRDLEEPFMVSVRQLEPGVKLIWWFVAQLEAQKPVSDAEHGFKAVFFDCHEALEKLTYEGDRDILRKAISLSTSRSL